MQEKISQVVKEALGGSRQIRITFHRWAFKSVGCLLKMALKDHTVAFNNLDHLVGLITTDFLHDWLGDERRTVVIVLTDKFDENQFLRNMTHALEKIEVVNK